MAKIKIRPKVNLHFTLGDTKTGKKVALKAGEIVEVDDKDIVNVDKRDYEVAPFKEPEKK